MRKTKYFSFPQYSLCCCSIYFTMKHYVYTQISYKRDTTFFLLKKQLSFPAFKTKGADERLRKRLFANLQEIQEQADAGAHTISFILQQ